MEKTKDFVGNKMSYIIVRKDKTSISCPQSPVYASERKTKFVEMAIAIVLIVAGISIMILIP